MSASWNDDDDDGNAKKKRAVCLDSSVSSSDHDDDDNTIGTCPVETANVKQNHNNNISLAQAVAALIKSAARKRTRKEEDSKEEEVDLFGDIDNIDCDNVDGDGNITWNRHRGGTVVSFPKHLLHCIRREEFGMLFHWAKSEGHTDLCILLRNHISTYDKLILAAEECDLDMIKEILVSHQEQRHDDDKECAGPQANVQGKKPGKRNSNGTSTSTDMLPQPLLDYALGIASRNGHLPACQMLGELGGARDYVLYEDDHLGIAPSSDRYIQWTGDNISQTYGLYPPSALHRAASNGHTSVVRWLLKQRQPTGDDSPLAPKNAVDNYIDMTCNTSGKTILGVACGSNHVATARCLLEHGANHGLGDVVSLNGKSTELGPLYDAISRVEIGDDGVGDSPFAIVQLLLEFGVRKFDFYTMASDETELQKSIALDCFGRPPTELEMAIEKRHVELLKVLLKNGASSFSFFRMMRGSCPDGDDSRVRVCRILIEHAARCKKSDNYIRQCLNESIVDGIGGSKDLALVELLLGAGADVNTRDHYDVNLLARVVENRDLGACSMLLKYGADPLVKSKGDYSALHLAASCCDDKGLHIFQLFLHHWNQRFPEEGKNEDEEFPLHVLCCKEGVSPEALHLLIEQNPAALVTAGGKQGLLPFQLACAWVLPVATIYTLILCNPTSLHERVPSLRGGATGNSDSAAASDAATERMDSKNDTGHNEVTNRLPKKRKLPPNAE